MSLCTECITVAARGSPLSRIQVMEVQEELRRYHPHVVFISKWIHTWGDHDKTSSLIGKDKTNFFTREIDEALLRYEAQAAIHSAKDLPDPLPDGLCVVAYTKGVDAADIVVFREGESWQTLSLQPKVGTSSLRRQKAVMSLRPDCILVDVRGTIEERLSLLDRGDIDVLVMAKAALLRLGLIRTYQILPGEVATMQGRLAIVVREDDRAMQDIFSCLHHP